MNREANLSSISWLLCFNELYRTKAVSLSLIHIYYALMGKEYYEKEYNYPMDKREFLNRLDECVMTLFLDENKNWVSSVIQILSWREMCIRDRCTCLADSTTSVE